MFRCTPLIFFVSFIDYWTFIVLNYCLVFLILIIDLKENFKNCHLMPMFLIVFALKFEPEITL